MGAPCSLTLSKRPRSAFSCCGRYPSGMAGVSTLLRRFGLSKDSTPSSKKQRVKQHRSKQSVNASTPHASPSFSPATPPSRSSSAVRATSVTASSAVILEEPFQIVKDRAATARAAAAEAVSLAKAAALAANQAAALAETHDLSVLGNLDALSREWWHVSTSSGDVASRSLSTTPSLSYAGDLRADPALEWQGSFLQSAQSPTDIFQQYIADKQRLSATFSAPSALPKAKKLSRKDSRKPPRQTPAPSPAAAPAPVRVLVASGKKGKRGPKERRSTKAAGASGNTSNKEMNVQKMLVMGVPGSLRDLMDATPGPSGLLSAEEEIQLSASVQVSNRFLPLRFPVCVPLPVTTPGLRMLCSLVGLVLGPQLLF